MRSTTVQDPSALLKKQIAELACAVPIQSFPDLFNRLVIKRFNVSTHNCLIDAVTMIDALKEKLDTNTQSDENFPQSDLDDFSEKMKAIRSSLMSAGACILMDLQDTIESADRSILNPKLPRDYFDISGDDEDEADTSKENKVATDSPKDKSNRSSLLDAAGSYENLASVIQQIDTVSEKDFPCFDTLLKETKDSIKRWHKEGFDKITLRGRSNLENYRKGILDSYSPSRIMYKFLVAIAGQDLNTGSNLRKMLKGFEALQTEPEKKDYKTLAKTLKALSHDLKLIPI